MNQVPSRLMDRQDDVRVAFVGGEAAPASGTLSDILSVQVSDAPDRLSWNRQIHSNRVVEAEHGEIEEADGLVSSESGLGLVVYTADCVPVLIAGPSRVAAVHAGWRGLADAIIPRAVTALSEEPGQLRGWIGPSIGPCCYEVSHDVATRVASASHHSVLVPRTPRPHLDLYQAAAHQLRRAGVTRLRVYRLCTRCQQPQWWSYRGGNREHRARNLAIIWRDQEVELPRASGAP